MKGHVSTNPGRISHLWTEMPIAGALFLMLSKPSCTVCGTDRDMGRSHTSNLKVRSHTRTSTQTLALDSARKAHQHGNERWKFLDLWVISRRVQPEMDKG